MQRSVEVEAVLRQFYEVMRHGDAGAIGALLSQDFTCAIGTDEEEWSTSQEHTAAAFAAQFEASGGFIIEPGSITGVREGDVGWFCDRALLTIGSGDAVPIRVTGVVRHELGSWRLVQTHMSVGVPNAELGWDLPI
jgi:ketosteroid isomerase-like protein